MSNKVLETIKFNSVYSNGNIVEVSYYYDKQPSMSNDDNMYFDDKETFEIHNVLINGKKQHTIKTDLKQEIEWRIKKKIGESGRYA
jgi:hypothetical protein